MGKRVQETFSDQLRRAIRASRQSLVRIAAGAGINDGLLSRFMRAERGLTTPTLDKVCGYLKLELRMEQEGETA
ncbi:MAG: hypothetical protein BWX88_02024 [Planctomycetes bacterium ADurb.Bin126]|nr:MAG: hypothetical protein BWX88_02024 [Planctomycetes bacterium ADurb.Bin126]